MPVLITVVGVALGYGLVSLVVRRTARPGPRRWVLLALVPLVYLVLLAAGVDMAAPWPRLVQAIAIATVLGTVVHVVGERRGRRPTAEG